MGFRLVTATEAASLVTLPALSNTCIFGHTHKQTDRIFEIVVKRCLKLNSWWYFATISISGAFAVTFSVVFAYVADVTEEADRSAAYGLVSATFAVSLVTSPALGMIIIQTSCKYGFHSRVKGAILPLNKQYRLGSIEPQANRTP